MRDDPGHGVHGPRDAVDELNLPAWLPTSATPPSSPNRFAGVITSVEVGGVMALVEIQAGDFRVVAALTRDSVEELRLAPGMAATATVRTTSVMVDSGDA